MKTKITPLLVENAKKSFFSNLDECRKRQFLAAIALEHGKGGVSKVSDFFCICKHTVYKGIKELTSNYTPEKGRVRRKGGGRKKFLSKHPEYECELVKLIESVSAGLPQDENVKWVSLTPGEIKKRIHEQGIEVSDYIVKQLLIKLGYRHRSFLKDLPMKEVKNRDEQFKLIADVKKTAIQASIPIISIDTKKKELIGNFKRPGKVYSKDNPKAYDHDFQTFAECQIVPHGIYDISRNVGYISIGTSHDTSEFVCDNIERVWNEHLISEYPNAETLIILCDGGGSNSSSHHIVKQDLMSLSLKLNLKILVMHYPPYCSKHNPIEHRLFSQISRSWNGEPLLSIDNAVERAKKTTTSKGLFVHVAVNSGVYPIKRKVTDDYKTLVKHRIVFHKTLPK